MLINYTIVSKIYKEETLPQLEDPITRERTGLQLIIYQEYLKVFNLIPFFPTSRKRAAFVSLSTEQDIPKKNWTPDMHAQAKEHMSQTRTSLKLWSLSLVFLLYFGYHLCTVAVKHFEFAQFKAQQEELLSSLQQDDMLCLLLTDKYGQQAATSARVNWVKGDTVAIQLNEERYHTMNYKYKHLFDNLAYDKSRYTQDEVYIYYSKLGVIECLLEFIKPEDLQKLRLSSLMMKEIRRE